MSAATLMAGLSPAQWRALNALFYAVPGGMNLAEFAANLDEIETRTVLALDAVVDRALTRLERAR